MKNNLYKYTSAYFLGKLSEYLRQDLLAYLDELLRDKNMLKNIETAVKNVDFFRTKKWESVFELGLFRILNYCLVRSIKPEIFLETGVLHGITSNFILSAIKKNGCGTLFSIDYPSYFELGPSNNDGFFDTLPPQMQPGWLISNDNKKKWKLLLGKSLDEMPKILETVDKVDIFLHDSEHSYENMFGEYSLVWGKIRDKGILISDNVYCNNAFSDFCKQVGREPLFFPEACPNSDESVRFALIQK